MLKSILKFTSLFVIVAIFSTLASFISYTITKNIMSDSVPASPTLPISNDPGLVSAEVSTSANLPDFYTVRLEGNRLNIYATGDSEEEFLYSEEIYAPDLTTEDAQLLSVGVTLKTSAELTSFIENFTS